MDPKDARVAQLGNLGKAISDARAMMRFFGGPKQISAFVNNKEPEPVLSVLQRLQNVVMVLFYPHDHICTLGTKQTAFKGYDFAYYGRWANRLWGLWILLVLGENFYRLRLLDSERKRDSNAKEAERVRLYVSTIGNLADLVIATSGSFEFSKPLLTPLSGSLLTLVACSASFRNGFMQILANRNKK